MVIAGITVRLNDLVILSATGFAAISRAQCSAVYVDRVPFLVGFLC